MNRPSRDRESYLGALGMDDVWFGRFWNPHLPDLQPQVREALLVGRQPEELLPRVADAPQMLTCEEEMENGFGLCRDGSMVVAVSTEMPDVTPAMWDWWFGWHSDDSRRYRLWHPRAHMFAAWADPDTDTAGLNDRQRYVGRTSFVDEYLGADRNELAIRFLPPADLGFDESALMTNTVIAARGGFSGVPLDAGYLVHHVRCVPGGAQMRSRFWLGGGHVSARGQRIADPALRLVALTALRRTEDQARALLVHCAHEMSHLAAFLPDLYAEAQAA
jgi:hypothetical protein